MVSDFALICLATTAIFLLAGLVKGIVGMGLPTVAMGLLALVMPPAQAAALLVVPSLATNVWQMLAGPDPLALARRLWRLLAGALVGTVASAGMLAGDGSGLAVGVLGAALILYALVGLSGLRFDLPRRHEAWASPLVGMVTGLVTGTTGVFVIPAVPYLQSLGLQKEELIQALGLSFTVSTLALAAGLLRVDAFRSELLAASLLAFAPALGGMVIGQWLRRRIGTASFRVVFFGGLLGLGAHLACRAAFRAMV
ncbi:MAG: TSUP family transporter [Azospirillum sp.]|nr:TSUP family transporter [Azospirillum sp.]